MSIETCEGYAKILAAVESDEKKQPGFHDFRGKLSWIVDRAKHYAEKTGLAANEILDAWERQRRYWYMNFYQESNQPLIEDGKVRVFATSEEAMESLMKSDFRCPMCGGVSKSPYECNSGVVVELLSGKKGPCDWKVYGLMGHLGKGTHIFVKSEMRGENIFMPIAWEEKKPNGQ